MKPGEFLHKNCRNVVYPGSQTARFPVPEHLILWSNLFPNYCPPFYEAPALKGKPWADASIRGNNNILMIRMAVYVATIMTNAQ